jgi:transglycosylase-like protein
VRKLMTTVVALCLVSVPAALAATGEEPAPAGDTDLIAAGALDRPLLRLEAHRKQRQAERRAERKEERQSAARTSGGATPPQLQAIAQCESGGDPSAVGGGGQFRGKYQFTYATWAAAGGSGDPASAPEAEQDRRAAALYAQAGAGQWPVCGG